MTRSDALLYLRATAINALFLDCGRVTTDSSQGYGPVIDRAMLMLGVPYKDLHADITIAVGTEAAMMSALVYYSYELLLPIYAMRVDYQVDAPLTDVKAGRQFDHMLLAKKHALDDLTSYGFGPGSAGFYRVNLDFLELNDERGIEYGTTRTHLGFPEQ
jgi:hypothetical protein